MVSAGNWTNEFKEPGYFKCKPVAMATYHFKDHSGLPPAFRVKSFGGNPDDNIFGLLNGEDLSEYKVARDCSTDLASDVEIFKKLVPTKAPLITHKEECYYQVTEDKEFRFVQEDKVIYAFGFNGGGFKHGPYHGKRILHLIEGNKEEAEKYVKK